jgi:uncharacterized protein (PEP-CTERM system associated)
VRVIGPGRRLTRATLALFAAMAALPAWAQLELPSPETAAPRPRSGEPGFGSTPLPDAATRRGTLGFPFGATAAPFEGRQGFNITPSLTLQQSYNDNIRNTARDHVFDYITSISPGLLVNLDTPRLQGTVNYAPNIQLYARNSSENRVDQLFNGQVLGTILADTLFLELRGSSAVQTLTGGFGPDNPQATSTRDNRQTTTSFYASPYLVQRFGGTATVQVGYIFQSVVEDVGSTQQTVNNRNLAFASNDFISNEVYVTARTGEDFGRFAFLAKASALTYDGTGALDGAYRNIGELEGRYAITPRVAALAAVGYQDQRYNSTPRIEINEPIWSVGVRLTPEEDSVLTARYGRRDGFNSASLDANFGIGVRTRVFASYQDRLSTSAQRAADLLSTTTVDALGNPIDANTGAPVSQPFGNSSLGVQGGVLRVKSGNLTLSQIFPRDTLTLSFTYEDRTPVAITPGVTTQSQTLLSGTFSWGHQLTERTSTINFVQYGTTEASVAGDSTFTTFGSTLVHQLTESLAGTLSYRLSSSGSNADNRVIQNVILAGLRQTF